MKAPCDSCRYVHSTSDARAVGRFGGDPMFVAAHAETPPRVTRAEAEADECAWRQAQTTSAPQVVAVRHPVVKSEPRPPLAPFPVVEMETAARAKAWCDFLTQVRLSLVIWEIDGDVRSGCEDVLAWVRRCRDDLAGEAS